jgi:hypothetical protein
VRVGSTLTLQVGLEDIRIREFEHTPASWRSEHRLRNEEDRVSAFQNAGLQCFPRIGTIGVVVVINPGNDADPLKLSIDRKNEWLFILTAVREEHVMGTSGECSNLPLHETFSPGGLRKFGHVVLRCSFAGDDRD